MRVFIAVLVLIFSLQSLTKADDIRDFEIEGMSIGDSLLDYFSEAEIKANIVDVYSYKKDKTFVQAGFFKKYNFSTYDGVQIEFKNNDKVYIVHSLTGKIFSNYDKDIKACFKHQDKVINELAKMFKNQKKYLPREKKHRADKSGKSKVRLAAFVFKKSRDSINIDCYDWHKDMPYKSNFKVSLSTREFDEWILANN